MSEASKAVFLSYASQDAGAARRIAEALRAAGVEVWFDANELVGGDAWDAKIRRQIRECALFMPVISASTQARLEGYFRREWRMAVERMHDMDDDMPFLVPVVIDDTAEATARVPDRFRERQWTRLPGGEAGPAFVERVAGLLEPRPAGQHITTASTPARAPRRRSGRRGRPAWMTLAFIAVGLASGVFYSVIVPLMKRDESSRTPPAPTDERPTYLGSVAVLPFHVISGPPEAAAFAEAVHEDLLTQLSGMRPLDTVSRTSTLKFRGADASVPEIGRALHADFIVEGSLQLDGARRRFTLQLIESATDRRLAAETFEREADPEESALVFQKHLAWRMAIAIYTRLKRERPPDAGRTAHLERVVGSFEAELVPLRARFWSDIGPTRDNPAYEQLLAINRRIIAIDPDNAAAHTDLGTVLSQAPGIGVANALDEGHQQDLLLTLLRGLHLNPEHFETQRNLGAFYLNYRGDPNRGLPHLHKAVRLFEALPDRPNNWPYYQLALALHRTGQSAAALRALERAPKPPLPGQFHYWLGPLVATRRFADAIAFLDRHAPPASPAPSPAAAKTAFQVALQRAQTEVEWTGDRAPLRALLDRIRDDPHATPGLRGQLCYELGDSAEALEEFSAVDPGTDDFAPYSLDLLLFRGLALVRTGNEPLARSLFQSMLTEMESGRQAGNLLRQVPGRIHSAAAFMHGLLGQHAEMEAAIARAQAGIDAARNYEEYLHVQMLIASAYTQAGQTARACATIDMLLSSPTGWSTGKFVSDIFFDQLRIAPEYQAVIRKHARQLRDPAVLDAHFAP